MAIREYIGARYVPLFADPVEWDNTRAYEPLTIVTYQGNSFTSKKSVPVGINILNTEYWISTGNYNAQIEAYRRETASVSQSLSGLEHDIDNLDSALGQVRIDVNANTLAIGNESEARERADTNINTRIDDEILARQAAIEELETQIVARNFLDFFAGFNMVCIGDSYSYGTGASDHLSGDTKRFTSLLAAKLEATEFNFAVGSTGFCDPGSGGQNMPFPSQVDRAVAEMSEEEKLNTHLVLIAGGINDYREGATYSASAMRTACASCCDKAALNFPNALILVVPMLLNGQGVNPRLFNFESAITDGAAGLIGHKRTYCINGAWTWNFGKSGRFATDKLHPNDTGHAVIANRIYANMQGGISYENTLESISWESGYGAGVDNGGYLQFRDGYVQSHGILMTLNGTLEENSTTQVATVSNACKPLQNIVVPITKQNKIAGCAIITQAGNLYIHADFDITTQLYIGAFSYIPNGAY